MTNFANIPKDDLSYIIETLNKHLTPGGYQLFVFGPRSQETPCKTHSDLDIAVKMDTTIPRKTLFNIEEDLEESNLNYRIDLLDLHRISESFRQTISHKLIAISPRNQSWLPHKPLQFITNHQNSGSIGQYDTSKTSDGFIDYKTSSTPTAYYSPA